MDTQHGQLLCRRGLQPAPNGPPDGEASVMIEVDGDGGPPMADLDLVPLTLTARITRPKLAQWDGSSPSSRFTKRQPPTERRHRRADSAAPIPHLIPHSVVAERGAP
jgi:hypothetical protein